MNFRNRKFFLSVLSCTLIVVAGDALCAVGGGVLPHDFSRYKIILKRRPFGDAPLENADTGTNNKPPVKTGPSFADSLRLCAITDVSGVIRVGFVNIKAKPIKSYFLFVGDSEDGIEVVDADYDAESVTLRKDGDVRTLTMSGGGASLATNRGGSSSRNSSSRSAFRSRRARIKRTRAEIEAARRAAIERKRPILTGKEYDDHIHQYNLDVIRRGGPALPVALTPEEDAQLVSEGVLPPAE
jgi:hypothetical protein